MGSLGSIEEVEPLWRLYLRKEDRGRPWSCVKHSLRNKVLLLECDNFKHRASLCTLCGIQLRRHDHGWHESADSGGDGRGGRREEGFKHPLPRTGSLRNSLLKLCHAEPLPVPQSLKMLPKIRDTNFAF